MNKEFIPYEQALELAELNFNDENCIGFYTAEGNYFPYSTELNSLSYACTAPLYQQAFRWFREKYNLLGGVYSNASGWLWEIHDNIGGTHRFGCDYEGDCEHSGTYTSFDKAELACLKKLIEIAKNK
jgi:hypothetical protein